MIPFYYHLFNYIYNQSNRYKTTPKGFDPLQPPERVVGSTYPVKNGEHFAYKITIKKYSKLNTKKLRGIIMNNNQITISTGITRFKKKHIEQALIHNHRGENSHKNIINKNMNYYYNLDNQEQLELPVYVDKNYQRKTSRRQIRSLYKKHSDNQLNLMIERNKLKGFRPPKEKDLNPMAEGIVNFGNVWDIRNDSNDLRIKKSNEFHNNFSKEDWSLMFEQIKDNLMKFAKETNTELIDLTFHRDEGGLYHFHYVITNYNNQTGEHLNVRQNKDGIGDKLQDIICEGFEQWDIGRAQGKSKGKKRLTKEELIEIREKNEEINKLNQQIEEGKQKVKDIEENTLEAILTAKEEVRTVINNANNVIEETRRYIDIMEYIIKELSDMDPNDKHKTKEKLNKILKSSKYAMGKDKFDIVIERMRKFEEVVDAFDNKGGGDGLLSKSLSNIRNSNNVK